MSEARDRRLRHPYTPDVAGLAALIARRLECSKRDEIKMIDVKTAKTLEIPVDRLTQLQGELRASGMFFCRQAISTTRYGQHPIPEQGQTVGSEW